MTVLGLRTSWRGPALVTVICIALVVAIAVGVEGLYPTRAQRVEYAATAGASGISNAFNGRGYALDTLGGITGVEVGFMGQILFPILGVVTAIGLTRRQEEAGRTELLTASRVGRPAPLAAAALLLVLTCAVTAVGLTASMAATGLPVVGSAWYAAGVGACVLFFAAVGLLLGELCQQARTAQQLGLGAVSVVYLTRFVIDAREVVNLLGGALLDEIVDIVGGDTPDEYAVSIDNGDDVKVEFFKVLDHIVDLIGIGGKVDFIFGAEFL